MTFARSNCSRYSKRR